MNKKLKRIIDWLFDIEVIDYGRYFFFLLFTTLMFVGLKVDPTEELIFFWGFCMFVLVYILVFEIAFRMNGFPLVCAMLLLIELQTCYYFDTGFHLYSTYLFMFMLIFSCFYNFKKKRRSGK